MNSQFDLYEFVTYNVDKRESAQIDWSYIFVNFGGRNRIYRVIQSYISIPSQHIPKQFFGVSATL